MRILYFHQHFSTPKGATGIRSYEMAKRLVSSGHHVTIVCGSYDGGQTGLSSDFNRGVRKGCTDGINIIEFDLAYSNSDRFLSRSLVFIKYAAKSIYLALTEKYDIVFATTTPLTAGIPGIFAKLLRRKNFVFEVRDLWPELPKAMGVIKNPIILTLMSWLEWLSYNTADKCIGLSPGIVDGIKSRTSNTKEITLIPNGCDLDLFSSPKSSYRPDGVSETDIMALFAGTHGKANGLNAILDMAKVLHKKNIENIKIVLVGQGREKPSLISRAKELGLTNIIFLEPVNKEKLSQLMHSADVGLQVLTNTPAFYYGTSPNKFFDYIASGLPVINNYPGWVADMISDHHCGLVVPPENPDLFAEALISLSQNREQLTPYSQNASKLAKEFDRAKLAVSWEKAVLGGTNEKAV